MKTILYFAIPGIIFATPCIADTIPEIINSLPTGKLAFVSGVSFGSPGTITVAGQSIQPFQGGNPEFTADGGRLVYSNHSATESKLFIRDLSTDSTTLIDTKAQNADSPSLSPDGSKLVFVVWPPDRESSQIYISDADGSNWIPLTTGEYYNWSPKWAPDGRNILFESTRDGPRQIYIMDSDGKNQINLSNNKDLCHAPSWSPDGAYIAYMSRGETNKANIFVMKSDGTDQRNVSNGTTRDSEPVWSPDGEWIAFTRTANNPPGAETMDIWIMRKDGTDQKQFTRNKEGISSYQMSWSR